jgi:hypothetical protein
MMLVKYLPYDANAINAIVSPSTFSTPPGPPPGDTIGDFYGAHWGARNNTTITEFINTYGVSSWSVDPIYHKNYDYSYVYVNPEKNNSKKLVFLYYKPNQTGINGRVIWVKLIDKGTWLPMLNESEARALGIIGDAVPEVSPDNTAATTPGFVTETAIFSAVLLLLYVNGKIKPGRMP